MHLLADRVVLITGANGGLGQAVTRAFLNAGAVVAGVARSWTAQQPSEGLQFLEHDVTSPHGARRAVEEALARNRRLDIVLHLVGGFAGGQPVHQTEDETWRQMMDLNLHSAFYLFRAALPHLLEARRGRLIAIGSRTGAHPVRGLSAYGVSKAALLALVRTLALEVRGTGVTANIVLPSVIDTPANRAANPGADYSKWVTPESIAGLLLWLASDAAADVNGAAIPIYGGA
jgi:NAD(P)-dependent dehydrogenase (short-subunit alcohol dehydrogenase family)